MSPKPTSDAKILIRSFGRRRTKGMRPTRTNALEEVLPWAGIKYPHPNLLPKGEGTKEPSPSGRGQGEGTIDPKSFFNTPTKKVWFEIGFGNGEHLLHQAVNNPDIMMIGCEPFENGVAAMCVGIKEKNVKNISIWPDDARLLMEKMKSGSLDRLFLLHPDPWPKTRHHKRRFVQKETLDEIARLLKPGAEFCMATDHADLAAWMMEKTYFHPAFEWTANSADDWRNPPAGWPETRYGQKGLKQGRPPVYLIFKRR